MKKTILIIASILLLTGCKVDGIKRQITSDRPPLITSVPIIEGVDFEDHRYVVIYSAEGCAIVHAASCPCKEKTK